MSRPITVDLLNRVEAWTERVASASASSQQEVQNSTLLRRTRPKRSPRAPLVPTSSNLGRRKRDTPDEVNTQAPQTRAVPAKRRKGTMADKSTKEPADLSDRKYPSRDRKPTVKARDGRDVAQVAQPKHRSSHPTPQLRPSMMLPVIDSYGNPAQLSDNQGLRLSDVVTLSNSDERDRPVPSPSKRPGSPSKASRSSRSTTSRTKSTRERTWERPKTDKSLTMYHLRSCSPSIRIQSIRDVFTLSQFRKGLPPLVDSLRKQLRESTSYVPQILQSQYNRELNTPNKTRRTLPEQVFQTTFAANQHQAERLQKRVAYVMRNASWNFELSAHERQWSTNVVSPIIDDLIEYYVESTMVLNLEGCSISPVGLRPVRHNGGPIDDADVQSNPATITTEDSTADSTTSRMIDLGIGLALCSDEQLTIDECFRNFPDGAKSLNQTLSYPVSVPIFLDIELKKTNSERQPEVQLGVWQAAGFTKRKYHGWNEESMPMPGICINGHVWTYYITFQVKENDDVVMIGPFEMGDTKTVCGTWEIVYKLDVMLRWGIAEYKQWFNRVVLGQATTAPSTQMGLVSMKRPTKHQVIVNNLPILFKSSPHHQPSSSASQQPTNNNIPRHLHLLRTLAPGLPSSYASPALRIPIFLLPSHPFPYSSTLPSTFPPTSRDLLTHPHLLTQDPPSRSDNNLSLHHMPPEHNHPISSNPPPTHSLTTNRSPLNPTIPLSQSYYRKTPSRGFYRGATTPTSWR